MHTAEFVTGVGKFTAELFWDGNPSSAKSQPGLASSIFVSDCKADFYADKDVFCDSETLAVSMRNKDGSWFSANLNGLTWCPPCDAEDVTSVNLSQSVTFGKITSGFDVVCRIVKAPIRPKMIRITLAEHDTVAIPCAGNPTSEQPNTGLATPLLTKATAANAFGGNPTSEQMSTGQSLPAIPLKEKSRVLCKVFISSLCLYAASRVYTWYTQPQPQSCTAVAMNIQKDLELASSLVSNFSQEQLTESACTTFLSGFQPQVDAMKDQTGIMQAQQTGDFFCGFPQPARTLRMQVMSVESAFMGLNMTTSNMRDACTPMAQEYLRPALTEFSSDWSSVRSSVQALLVILSDDSHGSEAQRTFLAAELPNCTQHLQRVADSLLHGMHLITAFRLDVAGHLATSNRSALFASQFRHAMSSFESGGSQMLPPHQNCHISTPPTDLKIATQKFGEHFSSCGLSLDQWVKVCVPEGAAASSAHHWGTTCQTSFKGFLASWVRFRGQAKRVVKHLVRNTISAPPLYLASLPEVPIVKFSSSSCQCQINAATHTYGKLQRATGRDDQRSLAAIQDHCAPEAASTLNLIQTHDNHFMHEAQRNSDMMQEAAKSELGETDLNQMTDAAVSGAVGAARSACQTMKGLAYVEGKAEGTYLGTGVPTLCAWSSMCESALIADSAVALVGGVAILGAAAAFGITMGLSAIAEYGMHPAIEQMNSALRRIQSDFEGIEANLATFQDKIAGVTNNVHSVCETDDHTKQEMKNAAWLGLHGCTTAMMTIHSDLTHAFDDVTDAVADQAVAHASWEHCWYWCGDPPLTHLPDNAVQKLIELQGKLDGAQDAMYLVAACSRGSECLPGLVVQYTTQMQQSMSEASDLAEKFTQR